VIVVPAKLTGRAQRGSLAPSRVKTHTLCDDLYDFSTLPCKRGGAANQIPLTDG
jgi:hypothetical protein